MKKQIGILFYVLGFYVLLQFVWWGYHLVDLTSQISQDQSQISKRIVMVLGEGLVFFTILIAGMLKIRSSLKKEIQLSERQTNFLLSVTHELKTPLASMKLYLQTMEKRQLDEGARAKLIAQAIQENTRLELLIDNILNASRIENNALNPVLSDQDLHAVLNDLVNRFNRRHMTTVSCDIESGKLQVDLFFLETILNNLLENALKYAGKEAQISVHGVFQSGKFMLTVTDNGPGVSQEAVPFIFDKFYRSGNEEIRNQKGSGLGLFIVSELARRHNGSIQYIPNSPKGAIFQLIL